MGSVNQSGWPKVTDPGFHKTQAMCIRFQVKGATLDEKGNRKTKYRITQDLLYSETNKDDQYEAVTEDGLQMGPPKNHPLHCGTETGLATQDNLYFQV